MGAADGFQKYLLQQKRVGSLNAKDVKTQQQKDDPI